MKIEELRIGNFVALDPSINWTPKLEDYIIEVDSIQFEGINDGDEYNFSGYRIKDIVPIKLNEEWLLKFGFEKRDVRFWQLGDFVLHAEGSGALSFFMFKSRTQQIEVLSVHQLQNLYFALTGEELSVK